MKRLYIVTVESDEIVEIISFDIYLMGMFFLIICVMDRPKGPLAHLLRPNTIQSPNTMFDNITCDTPLSHKGGAQSERGRFK